MIGGTNRDQIQGVRLIAIREVGKLFLMNYWVTASLVVIGICILPGCFTFRTSDARMKRRFLANDVVLTTSTMKIAGRDIHFAKTGHDSLPKIVFIHGTPGSWTAFSRYLQDQELLEHFCLVSIDRPGFGYSNFGMPEDLTNQARLLLPVIEAISGGVPVHLVGHSLGAPLIVMLAAERPDLVQTLVLVSGSVDPSLEKPEKWRPLLFSTPLNLLIPGAFRPSNKELWYLKKDLVLLQKHFPYFKEKVIFIHGSIDTWVPPANVEYAKKLLPRAENIEELMLDGGNHFIPWTHFTEIRNLLLELRNSKFLIQASGQ